MIEINKISQSLKLQVFTRITFSTCMIFALITSSMPAVLGSQRAENNHTCILLEQTIILATLVWHESYAWKFKTNIKLILTKPAVADLKVILAKNMIYWNYNHRAIKIIHTHFFKV